MSIDLLGGDAAILPAKVIINITKDHPLIRLAKRELTRRGVKESGLQRPVNIKSEQGLPSREVQERLKDRRAGIEPIIGHAKHGGQLGRSRMKSDAATLAAGYASVLGLNLRQLTRHQAGKTRQDKTRKAA